MKHYFDKLLCYVTEEQPKVFSFYFHLVSDKKLIDLLKQRKDIIDMFHIDIANNNLINQEKITISFSIQISSNINSSEIITQSQFLTYEKNIKNQIKEFILEEFETSTFYKDAMGSLKNLCEIIISSPTIKKNFNDTQNLMDFIFLRLSNHFENNSKSNLSPSLIASQIMKEKIPNCLFKDKDYQILFEHDKLEAAIDNKTTNKKTLKI